MLYAIIFLALITAIGFVIIIPKLYNTKNPEIKVNVTMPPQEVKIITDHRVDQYTSTPNIETVMQANPMDYINRTEITESNINVAKNKGLDK
jgi:hypothetical protein